MARWAMVIDLRACIGCKTCAHACDQFNSVPPGAQWRRVAEREIGEYSKERRMFLPTNCMHCAEPPCLEVCPTRATYKRSDGIVDIRHDRCIGCGYCIVACPYEARAITLQDNPWRTGGDSPTVANQDRIGICTKCNFCLPLLEQGVRRGLQPGRDPEATPNCVRSCIAGAMHFGNLDDPESAVSQLLRENRTFRLNEDLGTGPSVYYIL
jgi:phenylacetyl-CoA:acceptor oxidoreductase subunit 1